MNSEEKVISSIDLKNAVLATPLTKFGKRHQGKVFLNTNVAEDVYLENCFVDADFLTQEQLENRINFEDKENSLIETQDYDYFATSSDVQAMYRYHIEKRTSQAQKENFEKDLLGLDGKDLVNRTYSSVFMVEGPAGSGKTTYLRYLLKDNFHVDLCDVETATQTSCGCFNDTFDFKPLLSPITAIEMLLLSQIHKNLSHINKTEHEYKFFLNKICNVYHKQFVSSQTFVRDTEEFRIFFNILRCYCNNEYNYSEMTEKIIDKIKIIVDDSDKQIIDQQDINSDIHAIKYFAGILMRTYFCLSQIDGNKHILFLDNIERFIITEKGKPYIAIFDNELQRILNSIYAIADETEDLLYKTFDELSKINSNIQYTTSYGIVIAVRDSTLSLLKNNPSFTEYYERHHAENIPTYVNISYWFDYHKIFAKKINFYLGEDIESNNLFIHAFNNILNDVSLSKWCLRRLLLNLFNNNYRRFFENMTEVLCNYEDVVRYYNCIWDKAKGDTSPNAQRIRHLCRKTIIQIVLDYMQNVEKNNKEDGFFDSLMARCDIASPTNDVIAKSSYARRILTYLDNKNNEIHAEPVAFPYIVKALLHKPIISSVNRSCVSINDPRLDDIAEIITIASQTAKIHTNGVELLNINVDSVDLKKQGIAALIKQQWNNYRTLEQVDNKFNIRITPAGSVFAMLCPSFEYFVCRYKNNTIPLFMIKSEFERRKLIFGIEKNSDTEPCDEYGIYDKAVNCINSVLKYETRLLNMTPGRKISFDTAQFSKPEWLYDYTGKGKGVVHVLRILKDHMGYLQDYREFLATIDDDTYDNEHYKNDDKQGVIDQAIQKYKEEYNRIIKDYYAYVSIGSVPNL